MLSGKLYQNALQHRRSFTQQYRDNQYQANFKFKQSNYPSQYYPDLSPMDMCYLLQGENGHEDDEGSHYINTELTIRDVQLLLLQGKLLIKYSIEMVPYSIIYTLEYTMLFYARK